jgi:hypothetical protein
MISGENRGRTFVDCSIRWWATEDDMSIMVFGTEGREQLRIELRASSPAGRGSCGTGPSAICTTRLYCFTRRRFARGTRKSAMSARKVATGQRK